MKKIILTESQRQILLEHANNTKPNESCALLFGSNDGKTWVVKDIFLTENIEQSPVTFTISNEELIKGYNTAEEKKLDIVGIFHSHPSSDAYPSETDKKFMRSNPVPWVIFSGTNNDFRAYMLDSDLSEIQIEL